MENKFIPVNLKQGSRGWHAHRANKRNASDAPAARAVSPYRTRRSLVRQLATGITPEFTAFVQERILDKGHEFEALAGPLMQELAGVSLYPVVGYNGEYSASYDGLDMEWITAAEHKRLNAKLRECMFEGCTGTDLPIYHQFQMEHQCMVCPTIERVLFVASEWDDAGRLIEERHCWYLPNPQLRAELLAAWESVVEDARNYDPADDEPEVLEKKVHEKLPALNIDVHGQVLASNLADFERVVKIRIGAIATDLSTDQDFADATEDARWLRDVADRMELAKKAAREKMVDVDALFTMLESLGKLADDKALSLEKKVKKDKDTRKAQIVIDAQADLDEHMKKLNAGFGGPVYMGRVIGPFDATIKGMSSLDNMRDKVKGALAACIAEADARALRFTNNRAHLKQAGADWITLFADFATVGDKEATDFQGLAMLRITQHQQAQEEARRVAEAPAPAPAAAMEPAPGPAAEPFRPTLANIGGFGLPATVAVGKAAVEDDGSRIKLGDINARIAPLSIDAAGLADLGWTHVGTDKSAKLFREVDLPQILASMLGHLQKVHREAADEAAKASGLPF